VNLQTKIHSEGILIDSGDDSVPKVYLELLKM
jgi:hypothetical protein